MQKIQVKDFSIEHTLNCGQFFLHEKCENKFIVINGQNIFTIKTNNKSKSNNHKLELEFENIKKNELIEFLGLNDNLEEIRTQTTDIYLLEALEKYWGLRLIKQDLWQCMISFICSSASNIPKITTNLKLICEYFGDEITLEKNKYYTFPLPGKIDNIEKLKKAKTGYRAKYIYQTNEIVKNNPNILNEIKKANYEDAKKLLIKFPGIGIKVAECICLFSLDHKEAFPIDTWVKQIIEKLYLKKPAKNTKEIEQAINKYFNKSHRGLSQQYLFHWARHHLKEKQSSKEQEKPKTTQKQNKNQKPKAKQKPKTKSKTKTKNKK